MKKIIPALFIMFLCSGAHATESFSKKGWGKAYARRDFQLGITLDEFRDIPFPDEETESVPELGIYRVCSDEPLVKNGIKFLEAQLDYGDENIGIIKCLHYYSTRAGNFIPARLHMGTRWMLPTPFYFIRPEGQSDYFLFKIEGSPQSYGFEGLVESFTKLMGKPAIRKQLVHNAFNAQYLNVIATWENQVSRLRIEKYANDLETAKVTYTLKPLVRIYESRKAQIGGGSTRLALRLLLIKQTNMRAKF